MAESAFGVDHGDEVSKAFKMPGSWAPKMPKPVTNLGTKIGTGLFQGGAKQGAIGAMQGGKLGNARSKAGLNTAKAGVKMVQHPGATGAAAIGGAGGAAGGGYAAWRKKQKKPGQV